MSTGERLFTGATLLCLPFSGICKGIVKAGGVVVDLVKPVIKKAPVSPPVITPKTDKSAVSKNPPATSAQVTGNTNKAQPGNQKKLNPTKKEKTRNTSAVTNSGSPAANVPLNMQGGSPAPKVDPPTKGKGLETRGYRPQPGERTFAGYVEKNVPAGKEITLHTSSKGFNNNSRGSNPEGQFKRFGSDSHAGISPHVHQPTRNVNKNGEIFGGPGSKPRGGGVTPPSRKDISQLYDYLNNGKYRR